MLSLDTETTGVDFFHGARPFFVTTCSDDGELTYWSWPVDPLTREPEIPPGDLEEIRTVLRVVENWGRTFSDPADRERHVIVGQNVKFDVHALESVGVTNWPWGMTRDTLRGAHLLASNRPKDLTALALQYLGHDIQPLEDAVEKATQECRRMVQQARLRRKRSGEKSELADWMIADEDAVGMPSVAGEKKWKYDMWLPRAVFDRFPDVAAEHPEYETVLRDYALEDSQVTVAVWGKMRREIERRGLWKIFLEAMKWTPIAARMETDGVTVNEPQLDALADEYRTESAERGAVCVNLAASYGYELELPKGASPNNSLRTFCFDVLKLPVVAESEKTGEPSLDKETIATWLETLPPGRPLTFVKSLARKRKRDTAVSYLDGYRRYWIPTADPDTFVLHPTLNPTGTTTTRWSSSKPNEQNISKQETDCPECRGEGCDDCGGTGTDLHSLRLCFGPGPGREWWSFDAKNIERRLPAYECDETDIIALFERPDDPPYYGSEHLLIAHVLFPKEFEACRGKDGQLDGRIFKKKYASTLYQRTKNFNFAVQYGAIDRADGRGTADRTIGIPGAQSRVKSRFAKQEEMNQRLIRQANKFGYVETMPDRTVDPTRGYPLLCTRTEHGRILETIPFNYRYQSTAMWWMGKAMTRVSEFFDRLNRGEKFAGRTWPGGYRITLQVHDELVIDVLAGTSERSWESNLSVAREVKRLMELGGDDLGVPTPVSMEHHPVTWAKGLAV